MKWILLVFVYLTFTCIDEALLEPKIDPQLFSSTELNLFGTTSKLASDGKNDSSVQHEIPESFDSRSNWPYCSSIISRISSQGDCGACWAFSSVEAMSDRICIHSKGRIKVHLSTEDVLTCCGYCSVDPCYGGSHPSAYAHWVRKGIVSKDCKPYIHRIRSEEPRMMSFPLDLRPECNSTCKSNYSTPYEKDRYFGKVYYNVKPNAREIQLEIFKNGPVTGLMRTLDDYLDYAKGIYHCEKCQEPELKCREKTNPHLARILGWGIDDDVPYWLAANSYGRTWGEDGYFRIIRGINECGIEDFVVAGLPAL